MTRRPPRDCPCHSGLRYAACCGPRHGGERPADMLKGKRQRLAEMAARHGFIIAIADWNGNGTQAHYGFAEDEQLLVTGLLWHLRRTLQVDSNRVFLFGLGEGANLALDLGATHPDLFAGIIPMSPSPDMQRFHIFEYWKNFQNLPVYMVVGDRAGDSVKTIRRILESWMGKGYPSIGVSYKGRGFEWYVFRRRYQGTQPLRTRALSDLVGSLAATGTVTLSGELIEVPAERLGELA